MCSMSCLHCATCSGHGWYNPAITGTRIVWRGRIAPARGQLVMAQRVSNRPFMKPDPRLHATSFPELTTTFGRMGWVTPQRCSLLTAISLNGQEFSHDRYKVNTRTF